MIDYPMPDQAPDLFKGFREEVARAEKKKQEKEQAVIQMASKIEAADKSTMFGSDYSIASQWAQHLTNNLDEYASSTDGMIKFQQQAAQLNSFIDASEAYKKENFGSAQDGSKAGTWSGYIQRDALGTNVYGDFIDKRNKQSYEMSFMGLQQPIQAQWDDEDNMMMVVNGKAVPFSEYMRPENPFMPQLEEGKITLGSTWYAEKAPNKAHNTRQEAENYTRNVLESDPSLKRQAARYYQQEQKKQGKTLSADEILADTSPNGHLALAMNAWVDDATTSWINPNTKPVNQSAPPEESFIKTVSGVFEATDIPQSITPITEDQPGISPGFNEFYQLSKPIDNIMALGEDKKIIGFNIDALGQIWIRVQMPASDSIDPETGMKTEGEGVDYETMLIKPGTTLFNTFEFRMNQATNGNWDNISRDMFNLSKSNSQDVLFTPQPSEPPKQEERVLGPIERVLNTLGGWFD